MDGLVGLAGRVPVETFNRKMRAEADRVQGDHGLADTVAKQQASEFRHWFDHSTGMGRFTGALDPERYETLVNAVDHQTTVIAGRSAEPVTKNQNLAAQALVELVAGGSSSAGGRNKVPSITVIVDEKTLRDGPHGDTVMETADGHRLAPQSMSRLCCDATLRRVTLDKRGVPIDVGRTHRTATPAQWAALNTIYNSCGFEGCTIRTGWCQAHHIWEWDHGGPTDLDNLIPLCSKHHHLVHEGGWNIKLLPDRTLKIYQPNGRHHTTVPPPTRC